jgi:hypothetical protein
VIFVLPRLRRKHANGENVCNALRRGSDAGKLYSSVPVSGTANNDEATTIARG